MTEQATPEPFLSVIIPVYNRSEIVLRAIGSVLADPAMDIEIIVIDDASTDNTANGVAKLSDPRLHLLQLSKNGGCCVARNSGAQLARGKWLVFLDSDDELTPGSLDSIRQRALNAPDDVGKLLFACRNDLGAISPSPAFDGQFMDYHGYLRWIESTVDGSSEALPCTRRTDFLQCPYPDGRGWLESIHELNFVRRHRVQRCPELVRLYHADATNRLMVPDANGLSTSARGRGDHAEAVLSEHGTAMKAIAPRRWIMVAREAALYKYFAGDRRGGVRRSFAVIRSAPLNLRMWAVLLIGTSAPALLRRLWISRRAELGSS